MAALLSGIILAILTGLLGSGFDMDRDRAFYPVITIVVASYYVLFAAMAAGHNTLVIESLVGAAFLSLAVTGFRSTLWIVVAALFAHGVFDMFHGQVIANPGVPDWWPGFCMAYDVTLSGFLAYRLTAANIVFMKPGKPV